MLNQLHIILTEFQAAPSSQVLGPRAKSRNYSLVTQVPGSECALNTSENNLLASTSANKMGGGGEGMLKS